MNRVKPALAAGLLLATNAAIAPAQEGAPGLLRDIAQPPQRYAPFFPPGGVHFVPMGGALYTLAWEGSEGHELWRTDGTPAGTAPVVDVCPGTCSGTWGVELVESGGILYFVGNDGWHGSELWRSDGTAAGTWMVADIWPEGPSTPSFLTPAPGGVYFTAHDGRHGRELWWSDGTAAGTSMVRDILLAAPEVSREPTHLVMLGGLLLFAADDGVHGRELWRTDGSEGGTSLVLDLLPGPDGGIDEYQPFPHAFEAPAVAAGLAFFSARTAAATEALAWATDGTPEGTIPLHAPGVSLSSGWPFFFAFDDVVLFSGPERTLWRSDGTPGGTYSLGTGGVPLAGPFARLGERVLFPGSSLGERELWATDGTAEGTHLVKDVQPGPGSGLSGTSYTFYATADRLFFSANDGVHGEELWSSDGTEAGTAMVADLMPGEVGSLFPFFLVTIPQQIGQQLLFESWNGSGSVLNSLDLNAGTVFSLRGTADRPGSTSICGLDWVCDLIDETASGIAFMASDPLSFGEPWISDGHPAGTRMAADLRPGPEASLPWGALHDGFAQLGELLLVLAGDDSDQGRVFVISPQGVTQVPITFEGGSWSQIVAWNGVAYVSTLEGLWRTEGTPASTIQLAGGDCTWGELTPGTTDLFFLNFGRLWATDGTVEGTRRVAPSIDVSVTLMAATTEGGAQRLYFAGDEAATGRELWLTDGTDAGTRRVGDLLAGPEGSIPDDPSGFDERNRILVATAGLAYFVADDGTSGEELWVSDGSPGNATLLSARHGPESSSPRWLAAVGDRVYFSADDGIHGREPWITRGAPWDTSLLEDLRPGPGSSMPRELTAWGDRLALAADDGIHGMELWRTGASDEDHDPPVMHEVRPGPRPSSPMGLTVSNGRLFFFADDGVHGLEPWAWPIDPRLLHDGFESGDLREWTASPP